jgi:hypothetical protein
MATVFKDAKIWLAGYDLSAYTNAVALNYGAEPLDNTTFGNTTRTHTGGLKIVSAGVDGYWHSTPDAGLFANIGVVDKPFSVAPLGANGGQAFFFKAMKSSYTLGASVGELLGFGAEASTTGPMIRGLLLYQGTVTATGTSTKYVLGARSATQVLWSALHITAVSGTSPTLDVVVQSDANSGAGGEVDQITFTQANAVGSQMLSDTGAVTDTYYRISYTVGGTGTPTFSFAVVAGII